MLDGISFSEREFYQQQHQRDRRWGRAINFAVALHVVVFAGALYLPDLLDHKPLLDDVMTIDLVSLPEPAKVPAEPDPPAARQEPAAEPEPEPVAEKPDPVEAVPLEVPPPDPVPVVQAKPISVRPLKRKIRKAKDTRLVEEKQRQQQIAELKRQQRAREIARQKTLADARKKEKLAQDAARRARAELASVIRERETFRSAKPNTGSAGSRQINSAVEKQYYMDLGRRVQQLWILPEIKKWSSTLETRIEFTVLRDGRLVNLQIAHSSGDLFFDRFARETVRKASPMPPIPAVLRKDRMDVGLRFRPGGVQ